MEVVYRDLVYFSILSVDLGGGGFGSGDVLRSWAGYRRDKSHLDLLPGGGTRHRGLGTDRPSFLRCQPGCGITCSTRDLP